MTEATKTTEQLIEEVERLRDKLRFTDESLPAFGSVAEMRSKPGYAPVDQRDQRTLEEILTARRHYSSIYDLDQLLHEVERCHSRIQQLLEANNAEVERRRKAEEQVERLNIAFWATVDRIVMIEHIEGKPLEQIGGSLDEAR